MSVPRVLFVNHASKLSGAELVLIDTVRAFRSPGVFLFEDGPLRPALAAAGAIPVVPAGSSAFAGIKRDRSLLRALPHAGGIARMLGRLARVMRQYDVVYANSQKAFVLAALACTVPALVTGRRKLVWHLHDILAPGHFGQAQVAIAVRLANAACACVIVPSAAAAASFIAAGGRPALVRVVPNGLDAPAVQTTASRAGFDLDTPFIFGVFSRLSPWKGQRVVLEALARLPNVGCVIAGGALFGEEDYARSLVALAAELGVTDRVRFLGHRADVPALMRAVDAVVHPSTEPEPFGRTLVEAMLARRPVVAAAAGAVAEIITEGTGCLVPPGDAAALAAALRQVQARQGSGAQQAQLDRAEARARTCYGAEQMRRSIRAIVADVGDRSSMTAARGPGPVTGLPAGPP
ncbi:MAG: glycosyltransferase [Janthinobacterium lividum]